MITQTINGIKFEFTEDRLRMVLLHLVNSPTPESGMVTLTEFCETAFDVKRLKFTKHSRESVHKVNNEIAAAIKTLQDHAGITVTGDTL